MITYKFRVLPTKAQETMIEKWLEECRMLYNNFLEQRKNGWKNNKKSFSLYDQINCLPKLKRTYPGLKIVYSQVLQNVGIRVDLAFQAFFRRLKNHEKPGYPRFKGFGRYDSFCYPCCRDIKIYNDFIYLPKIKNLDWIKHREIKGNLKTVTIKRSHGKWFIYIVTDFTNKKHYAKIGKQVGIDVGILTFATLSDGNEIQNPRFFETKQKELAKSQRRFQKARDSKDKTRIKKTKKVVNNVHEKIVNSRHNFIHQISNELVKNYDILVLEDINTNEMLKKRWCNKQILDAAWSTFTRILTNKAECAGRTIVKVSPAYTSQTCSNCGTRVLHELKDRIFTCNNCNHSENRDLNASRNILTLGLQCLAKAQ